MLAETLEQLLTRLQITTWDLLLIGDGSGSRWEYAVGWGCVALLKDSFERKVFWGGMNNGTVNIAELMAYLAPISWYVARVIEAQGGGRHHDIKHIHIITDSDYARSTGSSGQSVQMTKNTVLWGAFALMQRQGFQLHWHWIPREDAALNLYVDLLSKAARAGTISTEKELSQVKALNLDEMNPWE